MSYSIFKPQIVDYSDDPRVEVSKPVKFTEDFLKNLECNGMIPLDIRHQGEPVGFIEDIKFIDGELVCNPRTNESLKNKGISPIFEFDTVDRGDYVEAVNGVLTSAGITPNPRSGIVYNDKGDNMAESEINEVLSNRVKELEREIAVKDNQIEANKNKLARLDELEKESKKLRKELDEKTVELEKITPLAEKHREFEENKKKDLIKEIADGDNVLMEKISDWDIDQLTTLKEHRTVSSEPRGIPADNAPGLNEGDDSNDEAVQQEQMLKDVESMFSELNTMEE